MSEVHSLGLLGGVGHLVDNSVFARLGHPSVAPLWSAAIRAGLLFTCGPFVLEALVSARDVDEVDALFEELTAGLPHVEVDHETWGLAYKAQRAMAERSPGWHRRPPIDYLVSAVAHQHGLGILHYDHDYTAIAADSGLVFRATWVAPPGTLERRGEQPQVNRLLKRAISLRLAQFSGDIVEEDVHRNVMALLDAAISDAGKPALAPP